MRVRLVDGAPERTPPPPPIERTLAPLDLAGATGVQIDFTRNDQDGKFALVINDRPAGMDTPFEAHIGDTQVWTIGNKLEWDHPFQMHGFFFQVLGADGRALQPLEWKDTVNVPVKGTVKVAIRYDDRPGMWMFHCHILDHADAGMMGMLHLMPAGHR
jgi:FtsP/CotA-like multicopper oxidase with cupredoxin domain